MALPIVIVLTAFVLYLIWNRRIIKNKSNFLKNWRITCSIHIKRDRVFILWKWKSWTRPMVSDSLRQCKKILTKCQNIFGLPTNKYSWLMRIQLHGAHGYLINQFLPPLTNERTDAYAGSLENRYLFAKEIIEQIRGSFKGSLWIRLSLTAYADSEKTK